MRFIRNKVGGAGYFISLGLTNAIHAMGWEMLMWDGTDPERVFEEYQPDIYIGDVRFRHRIPTRIKTGLTRVVATVDHWATPSPFPILDRQGYCTKWLDTRWIRKLNPAFLFHHTSPEGIEVGWHLWKKKLGFDVHSFLLAGDMVRHFDEGEDEKYDCDIAYVGGYWKYKSAGLHSYLLNYAHKYKTLIFGPGWPSGLSRANQIVDSQINKLFKTARFIPCIHEPHAREYGFETTERLYKIALCGGFTVSDPVGCIHSEDIFSEDEIIVARSSAEMENYADYFIKNPDKRLPYIERARARILNEHTYFHRLGKLLYLLDFTSQFNELKKKMLALGLGTKSFH